MSNPTVGEERKKLRSLLEASLRETRFSLVRRILAKDPSLSLDGPTQAKDSVSVMQLCAQEGFNDIVEIFRGAGGDLSAAVGTYTPLQRAVLSSNLDLTDRLLSLGADHAVLANDGDPEPVNAMTIALGLVASAGARDLAPIRVARRLLDGGASPVFAPGAELALSVMARAKWTDREGPMARLLADLASKGAPLDHPKAGSPKAPLRIALGAKNHACILLLIQLGAKTDQEALGVDLIDLAVKNGMRDFVPEVQAALMERTVRGAVSSAQPAEQAPAAAPAPSRRHVPSL